MADIDLSILGRVENTYDRYARAIRAEYVWVAEIDYTVGRSKVRQGFIDRDSIFSTEVFRARYEEQARLNLMRELGSLAG